MANNFESPFARALREAGLLIAQGLQADAAERRRKEEQERQERQAKAAALVNQAINIDSASERGYFLSQAQAIADGTHQPSPGYKTVFQQDPGQVPEGQVSILPQGASVEVRPVLDPYAALGEAAAQGRQDTERRARTQAEEAAALEVKKETALINERTRAQSALEEQLFGYRLEEGEQKFGFQQTLDEAHRIWQTGQNNLDRVKEYLMQNREFSFRGTEAELDRALETYLQERDRELRRDLAQLSIDAETNAKIYDTWSTRAMNLAGDASEEAVAARETFARQIQSAVDGGRLLQAQADVLVGMADDTTGVFRQEWEARNLKNQVAQLEVDEKNQLIQRANFTDAQSVTQSAVQAAAAGDTHTLKMLEYIRDNPDKYGDWSEWAAGIDYETLHSEAERVREDLEEARDLAMEQLNAETWTQQETAWATVANSFKTVDEFEAWVTDLRPSDRTKLGGDTGIARLRAMVSYKDTVEREAGAYESLDFMARAIPESEGDQIAWFNDFIATAEEIEDFYGAESIAKGLLDDKRRAIALAELESRLLAAQIRAQNAAARAANAQAAGEGGPTTGLTADEKRQADVLNGSFDNQVAAVRGSAPNCFRAEGDVISQVGGAGCQVHYDEINRINRDREQVLAATFPGRIGISEAAYQQMAAEEREAYDVNMAQRFLVEHPELQHLGSTEEGRRTLNQERMAWQQNPGEYQVPSHLLQGSGTSSGTSNQPQGLLRDETHNTGTQTPAEPFNAFGGLVGDASEMLGTSAFYELQDILNAPETDESLMRRNRIATQLAQTYFPDMVRGEAVALVLRLARER